MSYYKAQTQPKLRDTHIRLILTPVLGIVIPHLSGLLCSELTPLNYLVISYLYYTLMMFLIWQGNLMILQKTLNRFSWTETPYQKLFLLLSAYIMYTITVVFIFVVIWYSLIVGLRIHWPFVFNTMLITTIAVLFISHVYETVLLIRTAVTGKIQAEQLERAKAQAELEALKNQIDPHFIFNSLNTLSFLIEKDREKAGRFNENLADVYRYILQNKSNNFVFLEEELLFAENYFSLLRIRFGNSVQLRNGLTGNVRKGQYLIPPISLQILLENAVKHNEFSEKAPLIIELSVHDNTLLVKNEIRLKKQAKESSQIGLTNLNERYRLLVDKPIAYRNYQGYFVVTLPLLQSAR